MSGGTRRRSGTGEAPKHKITVIQLENNRMEKSKLKQDKSVCLNGLNSLRETEQLKKGAKYQCLP